MTPEPDRPAQGSLGRSRTPPAPLGVARRAAVILLGLAAALFLLAAAALLLLQQPGVSRWALARLIARASQPSGTSVSLEAVRGDWITHLEVRGLRVARGDTVVVRADTLRVAYSALDALAGRFVIHDLRAAGAVLTLTPPDSTRPGRPPLRLAEWVAGAFWSGKPIRIERATLARCGFETAVPGRVPRAEGVELSARRIAIGGGTFAFEIDTLSARFLPARTGDRWCILRAGASLDRRRLEIRSLSLASPASRVDAHGALALASSPRDSITEAVFSLRAPRLDLADLGVFSITPTMSGVVSGEAELRGTRLQTLRGTIQAETKRARIGTLDIGPTRLGARVDGGRVDLTLASEVAQAPVEARGWARPFDPAPSGELEGRSSRLPRALPAAPWWDPNVSRSARFHAALAGGQLKLSVGVGSGTDLLALSGTLDFPVATSYRGHRVTLARSDNTGTALPGGSLAIDSLVVTLGRVPSYRVFGARFSHVDLALWTRQHEAMSDLNGRLDGGARGWRPVEGDAIIQVEPSTLRGQSIERANLSLSLRRDEIVLQGDAQSPSGQVEVRGRARPFDQVPSYEAEEIRIRGVDVGAWLPSSSVRTHLDGTLRARLAGKSARSLTGSFGLRLEPSSVNGFSFGGADAHGTIESGRLVAEANLDSRSGGTTVECGYDMAAEPARLTASGHVANALLARLIGLDSLEVTGATMFRLDANGLRPQTARVRCSIEGRGRIAAATIDSLHAELALADGVVSVDTLFARSNVGFFGGAGRIALADTTVGRHGGLRVSATVVNALPLATILHLDTLNVERAVFEGRLERDGGGLRFDVAARLRRLTAGSLHVFDVRANAEGTLGSGRRLVNCTAGANLDRINGPGIRVTNASASIVQEGHVSKFEAQAHGAGGHDLNLAGTLESDSLARRIRIETLDLVSKRRHWSLAEPARLTMEPRRLTIESFDLRADSGRVFLAGVVDRRGTQDLSVELKAVEIDVLTAWLGRPDMRGTFGGSLRLDGPAASPHAKGTVAVVFRAAGAPAGLASLAFDWDAARLSLDGGFTPADGVALTIAGRLPYALSLAAPASGAPGPLARVAEGGVDLRLRGDGVLLASLAPFFDPAGMIPREGTLHVDARLTGPLKDMAGSGRIDLDGGLLEFPSLGVKYSGIALRAELTADALEIREARLNSGPGSVTASGRVRLASGGGAEVSIDLHPSSFTAIRMRDYRSTLSGDVHLGGTLSDPTMTGSLTFVDTDLYLTAAETTGQIAAADLTFTADDERMLEEAFGYTVAKPPNVAQRYYDAANLDLKIVLGSNTWVRQRVPPRLAIQLTGSFQLRKAPHGEALLVGRIAPVPGRGSVEQFARQFDLVGGEILLNGGMKSHVLDVKAEYKVPSGNSETRSTVVVHLDIQGSLDQMKLILSSDPPLDQSDIISYIVTGQTAFSGGRSKSEAGSEATTLATQIALSGVTSKLEDLAQQKIGVDVVEVRQDGMEGVTLIAGQYVTPELYVGFRQPVGSTSTTKHSNDTDNKTQYELNYEVYRWLFANLQGETSKFKSFLRARREY